MSRSLSSPSARSLRRFALALCGTAALAPVAFAQTSTTTPDPSLPVTSGQVEVTTTRVPETVEEVPAEVTVITAEELQARGVHDMAGALAMVGGVVVAPGGEEGPAGFVPELWGLREIDAFLLVVDGVPWGGTFNPAVSAISLEGVERIEVLRGAAPVMYGSTAFSGVIHVIHRAPGAGEREAQAFVGSNSSFGASAVLPFGSGAVKHLLVVDGESLGFADDRAESQRGHVLYRASGEAGGGSWHLDFDALMQDQVPNSPHPRGNAVTILDPRVPLDANHNPSDAHLDEDRFQLGGGYDRALLGGTWSTMLSFTQTRRDRTRGFVRRDAISSAPTVTADGFRQEAELSDLYLDSHLAWQPSSSLQVITGLDLLIGKGEQESENFEYVVRLDGKGAPSSSGQHIDEETELEDERTWIGAYGQVEWKPTDRFEVTVGLRVNHTREELEGEAEEPGEIEAGEEEGGSASETLTKVSGVLGMSYLAWGDDSNGLWVFGDYRHSFKPAALDFGPEAEADILEPETSDSFELGLKGNHGGDRLRWQLTAFEMKLENLLMPQDGGLINGGKQRYRGIEAEAWFEVVEHLVWQVSGALHESEFTDFVQFFDPGVPTVLDGNRQELTPEEMFSTGIFWAPAEGFNAHASVEYVGDRFLNRRNTVLAPSYWEYGAGVGYRFASWEVRLDGENLGDERPAVSESELGDAQFYRLPERDFRLSARVRF